jgi:hypothetical protein
MNEDQAKTILSQIGGPTVAAISGGRWRLVEGTLFLPIAGGYSVEIDLYNDLYNVRRVFKRGTKKWVKGERKGVYCDQISDVAYDASSYVNVEWGKLEV